jgi:hypothetical protein
VATGFKRIVGEPSGEDQQCNYRFLPPSPGQK